MKALTSSRGLSEALLLILSCNLTAPLFNLASFFFPQVLTPSSLPNQHCACLTPCQSCFQKIQPLTIECSVFAFLISCDHLFCESGAYVKYFSTINILYPKTLYLKMLLNLYTSTNVLSIPYNFPIQNHITCKWRYSSTSIF